MPDHAFALFNVWHAVDEPPTPYLVTELDEGGYGVTDTNGLVCTKFSVAAGAEVPLRYTTLTEAMRAGLDFAGFSFAPVAYDPDDNDSLCGHCDECGHPCTAAAEGCPVSPHHMAAMDPITSPEDAAAWANRLAIKQAAAHIVERTRHYTRPDSLGARYIWVHAEGDTGDDRSLRWANRLDGSVDNEIPTERFDTEYEDDVLDALDAFTYGRFALWRTAVVPTTVPAAINGPTFDPEWTLFKAPYGDDSMARLDLRRLVDIAR